MMARPLRLGNGQELFAMQCEPDNAATETCVVMLNAGLLDQTGPYGLHVRLSEVFADMGIASLRVDLSGKGESAERKVPDHAAGLDADRVAIEQFLDAGGYRNALLLGLCSGAMDAVEIATRTDRFTGRVLIDGFARNTPASMLRYYFRRLLRPAAYRSWLRSKFDRGNGFEANRVNNPWPDPEVQIAQYRQLLAQRIAILAVYTRQLEWYYNSPGQLAAVLGPCENLSLLEEVLLPDADHIFTTLHHRQQLIDTVSDWLRRFNR